MFQVPQERCHEFTLREHSSAQRPTALVMLPLQSLGRVSEGTPPAVSAGNTSKKEDQSLVSRFSLSQVFLNLFSVRCGSGLRQPRFA